eukprot:1974325-Lingulodinium_polyedra.AAC.1
MADRLRNRAERALRREATLMVSSVARPSRCSRLSAGPPPQPAGQGAYSGESSAPSLPQTVSPTMCWCLRNAACFHWAKNS